MKIKQQKQIQAFLVEEFGKNRGSRVFVEQENVFRDLIDGTKGKSENQMKTLAQTILRCV